MGENSEPNLYGFVRQVPVGRFDFLGLLDVDLTYNPTSGSALSSVGQSGYDANPRILAWTSTQLSGKCNQGLFNALTGLFTGCNKVTCTITLTQELYFNNNKDSAAVWATHTVNGVVNHERKHVDSLISEYEKILIDLRAEPDTFATGGDARKAAAKYWSKYSALLAKAGDMEAAHNNPDSPRDGKEY